MLRFLKSHAPFQLPRRSRGSDSDVKAPDPAAARLPPEIWFRIADMLSSAEIKRLALLNRVFFNVAMNHHYRTIHADVNDCDRFNLSIGHWFGRRPVLPSEVLNQRTRHLHIENDSVCLACYRRSKRPPPSKLIPPMLRSYLLRRVAQESALKAHHCCPQHLDLLRGLASLPRLQELSLHLSPSRRFRIPGVHGQEPKVYPCRDAKYALLSKLTLGGPLAQRLRVLHLKGNFADVLTFLHSLKEVPRLPSLVHLSMDLTTFYTSTLPQARFYDFLKHLTSTVQTLEFHGSLDHEYCWKSFSSIPTFPHLKALRVSIDKPEDATWRVFFPSDFRSMSERLSGNRQGLVNFLQRHSHVEELTFQHIDPVKQDEAVTNETWDANSKGDFKGDHLTFPDFGSITMPNLRRLTLNINRFHGNDAVFKNIPQFIQQSNGRLEFFSCEGTYLHHDEILVLLGALGVSATSPTMLREVCMCTKTVTHVFLTQLREVCSHLESVAIRWTAGSFDLGFLTTQRQELAAGNAAPWRNMKFIKPLSIVKRPGEPPELACLERLKGGRIVQDASNLSVEKHEAGWMDLGQLLALAHQPASGCRPAHT